MGRHPSGLRSEIVLSFRQLFDQQSPTYTYLLADSAMREAVLVESLFEQVRRDAALIDELDCICYTQSTPTSTPIT
jgi:hypothetical protein